MLKKWIGGLCALSLATILGCAAGPGGGNLISAAAKIAFGRVSTLTPNEVQVLVEAVNQNNPEHVAVAVDDAQAAAAVSFLKANDVNTIQDLQNLIDAVQNDPNSVVIPDAVLALIAAGDLPEVTGQ